jgi:hypothetical protein
VVYFKRKSKGWGIPKCLETRVFLDDLDVCSCFLLQRLAQALSQSCRTGVAMSSAPASSRSILAAADCIKKADALLICTGAGMGVDSGISAERNIFSKIHPLSS